MNADSSLKSTLSIRNALKEDAAAIAEIYNESVKIGDASMDREEKSAEYYEAIMHKFTDRESYFILEDHSQNTNPNVVGWSVIKSWSDRYGYRFCAETSIFLRRNLTGQGYGQPLMRFTLEQAKQWQYHHLIARIKSENRASIYFHEQLGYEVVGVQKEIGFLDGKWQDVTLLQCLL
jgi:phosphinothricin acetyltransferase